VRGWRSQDGIEFRLSKQDRHSKACIQPERLRIPPQAARYEVRSGKARSVRTKCPRRDHGEFRPDYGLAGRRVDSTTAPSSRGRRRAGSWRDDEEDTVSVETPFAGGRSSVHSGEPPAGCAVENLGPEPVARALFKATAVLREAAEWGVAAERAGHQMTLSRSGESGTVVSYATRTGYSFPPAVSRPDPAWSI